VPSDLRDEGHWRRRYGDLEQDLDAESRPRREALPGWPLARVTDPFALEVPSPEAEVLADACVLIAARPARGLVRSLFQLQQRVGACGYYTPTPLKPSSV
jgi:hypothetical protein